MAPQGIGTLAFRLAQLTEGQRPAYHRIRVTRADRDAARLRPVRDKNSAWLASLIEAGLRPLGHDSHMVRRQQTDGRAYLIVRGRGRGRELCSLEPLRNATHIVVAGGAISYAGTNPWACSSIRDGAVHPKTTDTANFTIVFTLGYTVSSEHPLPAQAGEGQPGVCTHRSLDGANTPRDSVRERTAGTSDLSDPLSSGCLSGEPGLHWTLPGGHP